jgi:hypothetical protein
MVGLNRWFRYPAGFSEGALDLALASIDLSRGGSIVDPFAGAATGGTALVDRGCAFRGLEAHPLVAELAQLKFARPGDPAELPLAAKRISDVEPIVGLDGEPDLIRRSFSPETLADLTAMRNAIKAETSEWAPHLKWALLGALREVARVRAGWPYQMPTRARRPIARNARQRFLLRAMRMASDLRASPERPDGRVVAGDARLPVSWESLLGDDTARGCVSSPPYLKSSTSGDRSVRGK